MGTGLECGVFWAITNFPDRPRTTSKGSHVDEVPPLGQNDVSPNKNTAVAPALLPRSKYFA